MGFQFSRLLTVASIAVLLSLPFTAGAATVTVTETADSFDDTGCSLREAIQEVNLLGGYDSECVFTGVFGTDDTINLTAQTYVLSIDGPNDNDNTTGDLDVWRSLNLVGAGSSQTSISASGFTVGETDRVLHVTNIPAGPQPITINLSGLTIRDGNSTPSGSGGGARLDAFDITATLTDVTVTENLSEEDAGGIGFFSSNGEWILINSRVTNNVAPDDGGGIDNGGRFIMINSTVDGNENQDTGGGIRNSGQFLAINSTISRNILGSISPQAQGITPRGGGLYNTGQFTLINTTVSNNQSEFGGGIYSIETLSDGGLSNVIGLIFNATIAQNTADTGGGICFNCDNPTTGVNGEIQVFNTLIADNSATASPDCMAATSFTSGGFNLIGDDTGCVGFAAATNDQLNVANPGIGALQNNGGPTETHALLMGSPAIDMANNVEGCQAPVVDDLINGTLTLVLLTEDQRSFVRPIAVLDPAQPICDVGAYEFQTFDLTVTKDDGLNGQSIQTDSNFTYTITVNNIGQGDVDSLTLGDPLPAGMDFVSVNPSQGTCSQAAGTVNCDLGTLAPGDSLTVAITVTAAEAGTFTNVVTVTSQSQGQEPLTRTATETTVVIGGGGGLLEGSGFSCSLNTAHPSSGAATLAGIIFLAALLVAWRNSALNRH